MRTNIAHGCLALHPLRNGNTSKQIKPPSTVGLTAQWGVCVGGGGGLNEIPLDALDAMADIKEQMQRRRCVPCEQVDALKCAAKVA